MIDPLRPTLCLLTIAGVLLAPGPLSTARGQSSDSGSTTKEALVTMQAHGKFDVTLIAQDEEESANDPSLGRMRIDKQLHGDLEATGKGQMLSASTKVKGSAGYVAIERVTGTLNGRSGSFVLQHSGTMTRGVAQLVISVVPDSGTGDLEGLAGSMSIDITDGQHFYTFEYTLPESP